MRRSPCSLAGAVAGLVGATLPLSGRRAPELGLAGSEDVGAVLTALVDGLAARPELPLAALTLGILSALLPLASARGLWPIAALAAARARRAAPARRCRPRPARRGRNLALLRGLRRLEAQPLALDSRPGRPCSEISSKRSNHSSKARSGAPSVATCSRSSWRGNWRRRWTTTRWSRSPRSTRRTSTSSTSHPATAAQFEGYEPALIKELEQYLGEQARREGYVLLSKPEVSFETDDDLEVGLFGIANRMIQRESPEQEPEPAPEPGETRIYRGAPVETEAATMRARAGARADADA